MNLFDWPSMTISMEWRKSCCARNKCLGKKLYLQRSVSKRKHLKTLIVEIISWRPNWTWVKNIAAQEELGTRRVPSSIRTRFALVTSLRSLHALKKTFFFSFLLSLQFAKTYTNSLPFVRTDRTYHYGVWICDTISFHRRVRRVTLPSRKLILNHASGNTGYSLKGFIVH